MQEVDWTNLPGRLIVLSGPSGSGKSTLVRRLLERPGLRLEVSVSATTRPPRPGERPAAIMSFSRPQSSRTSVASFSSRPRSMAIRYGTPAEPVRKALEQGTCVILVIDVQGGIQVREKVPSALLIFVQAPGLDVLEQRLRARGTDDEAIDPAAAGKRPARARARQVLRCSSWSTMILIGLLTSWRQSWFRTIVEVESIMIDELKEEEIVNKVGGRFKLSTLIQKRMIALNQGARALVDGRGVDKMTMVIQEIMQDKIYLDMSGKLQTNEPTEELEVGRGDGRSYPVHRMSRPGRRPRRTRRPDRKDALIRRPNSKWRTWLQAPSGELAGLRCGIAPAAPGDSMLVRQRLLRLAPALTFLLLNLFLALSLGGYDPADAPGSGAEPANHSPLLSNPCGPVGATLAHVLFNVPGLVVVADAPGSGRRQRPGRGPPQGCRPAGPRVGLRLGRWRCPRADSQVRPRHQAQPAGGQRWLRRAPWPPPSCSAISARTGCC